MAVVRDFDVLPVFRLNMRRPLLWLIVCAWAVLSVAAPAAVAAGEPVVSTGNANSITSTSATLTAAVNPEGQATSYYFEYGTTTSYGSRTTLTSAGSGTAGIQVSASLASLSAATTYHYRVVASNTSGTTLGADVAFKTPKPPVPVVATRPAQGVTQTSATLVGTVDPVGQATSYFFQYGTSTAYGSQTLVASAGAGTVTVPVSAAIGPLTPGTTYHYRVVASNAAGTTNGHDVAFKTGTPPTGVTIASFPSTITVGQVTGVSGRVLAPRPAHVTVTLQSARSAGGPWVDAATTTAASSGAYAFQSLAPTSNTYYRAAANGATSSPILVLVRFRVAVFVSRNHPPPGSLVRFHGRVAPGHSGLRVLIQRMGPLGRWHTIRLTRLHGLGPAFSSYSVKIRVPRSGRYRVVVVPDGSHARGRSRVVRLSVR